MSHLNAQFLQDLWDGGNKEVRNWVKDHLTLMPRILSARVIVYRDYDPLCVYLRETSSGRFGILGGAIEVRRDGTLEDSIGCAIREAGEEGEFQDLRRKKTELITLVGKDSMRVSGKKAILRGLVSERVPKGKRVRVSDSAILMYATPTGEYFKSRSVVEQGQEARDVVCVNLRKYFGKNASKKARHHFRPTHIRVLESWYRYHSNSECLPAAMVVRRNESDSLAC